MVKVVQTRMRLFFVLVTVLLRASFLGAQSSPPSPADAALSSAQDEAAGLPVSLDRIREQMNVPVESRLKNVDVRPDFSVHVQEQRRIDEMLSKLDFSSGPAPAGGLYGYEQQRMLFNPTSQPLQQPYAAYSPGQFFTVAVENLLRVYMGDAVKSSVTSARRAAAEAAARREVDENIAAYCAARADRDDIQLCTTSTNADVR